MNGHPHKGKRSEWFDGNKPPSLPGRYEVVRMTDNHISEAIFSDQVGWHVRGSIGIPGLVYVLFVCVDKWRGLAEEPK